MFSKLLSPSKFRPFAAVLAISSAGLLTACGAEAPPCNDPTVTGSVLELIVKAHDDNLREVPFKSKDLATFALEAPELTAYDDKLKTRSCKVTFSVQVSAERVSQMSTYMAAITNPVMNLFGSLGGLSSLAALGGADPRAELQAKQADVGQFLSWNREPLSSEPVRKSVVYRIQKEEGGKDFYVHTNVDVAGSIQYLRIAAQAEMQGKRQAERADNEAKKQALKRAEIDRLTASGTWRKEVSVYDFRWDKDPEYCERNNAFCFVGQANDLLGNVLYMIKWRPTTSQASKDAISKSLVVGTTACLIGLRKGPDNDVFTFNEWSTVRDNNGALQDCRPGAASAEAAAKSGVAAAAPAGGTQPATALPGAPESLMALIARYEACGEEAVCLHTSKGNTVWMQAAQMRRMDYALLDRAISSKTPVCLRELTRTDAKNFTAESLDSQC